MSYWNWLDKKLKEHLGWWYKNFKPIVESVVLLLSLAGAIFLGLYLISIGIFWEILLWQRFISISGGIAFFVYFFLIITYLQYLAEKESTYVNKLSSKLM